MGKYLFLDRDGTLIHEPEDEQVDSLAKLELIDGVIPALLELQRLSYHLVMITNQEGIGSATFSQKAFDEPHEKMLKIFSSQGITFDRVLICPHKLAENCLCRKPHLGLVREYLMNGVLDPNNSFVIGDRETDLMLAKNMGIRGLLIGGEGSMTKGGLSWTEIVKKIAKPKRVGQVHRKTKETDITVDLDLDSKAKTQIATGIGFFDHMLEQISRHGGFQLKVKVAGDLHIDDHHTVEDVGLALGQALKQALGDKFGIGRYGFTLPMDECLASAAIDLSGRPYYKGKIPLTHEKVGELSAQMVEHFFRSLSESLGMNLHLTVKGDNDHHKVESAFKAFARALRQAIAPTSDDLPSTKGVL